MAVDRSVEGYEPRFDIDLAFGQQAELFVSDIIGSLGSSAVEVKRDFQFQRTGNLYVEFEHDKGRTGRYTPSGISVTKATTWVFVLDWNASQLAFAVPVETLKTECRRLLKAGRTANTDRGSCPTRGVTLPLHTFIRKAS